MIIKENQSVKALDLLAPRGKAKVDSTAKNAPFSEILGEEQKICPYSHLDVGGCIKYKGVFLSVIIGQILYVLVICRIRKKF